MLITCSNVLVVKEWNRLLAIHTEPEHKTCWMW